MGMNNTVEVSTSYGIYYATKEPVSVDTVVESLRGLEDLLRRTGPFIEAAFPGLKVLKTDVLVSEVRSGSLKDVFAVKFLCGGEKNAEELEQLAEKIMAANGGLKTVVAAGVGALLMYGVMGAIGSGTPSTSLTAYNSVVIKAAGNVNIGSDAVNKILRQQKDQKKLAKSSIDAFRPAKEDNAHITIDGAPQLDIPSDAVKLVPKTYEPPVPSERTDTYSKVDVSVYASDRDRVSTGWAGAVVGVTESRTKIRLADGIDPAKLHGKTRLTGDVVITYRYQKSKKAYVPNDIELTAIY